MATLDVAVSGRHTTSTVRSPIDGGLPGWLGQDSTPTAFPSRCTPILSQETMLPTNLADWPSAGGRPIACAARRQRSMGAGLFGLALLGGLIGIAFYHWVIP